MVHMGPCTHVGDLDLFYFVERHKERSSNIKTGRNNTSIHRFNPQMEAKGTRLKPGAWNFIWVAGPVTSVILCSLAGSWIRSWVRNRAARTQVRMPFVAGDRLTHCSTRHVPSPQLWCGPFLTVAGIWGVNG